MYMRHLLMRVASSLGRFLTNIAFFINLFQNSDYLGLPLNRAKYIFRRDIICIQIFRCFARNYQMFLCVFSSTHKARQIGLIHSPIVSLTIIRLGSKFKQQLFLLNIELITSKIILKRKSADQIFRLAMIHS